MAYLKVSRRFKMTQNEVNLTRPVNIYFYYGDNFLGASNGTSLQKCLYNLRESDRLLNSSIATPYPSEFRIDHHSGWDVSLFANGVPKVIDPKQDKEDLRKNLVP